MSTKHTPGPWRVGPINYADVYGSDGELVALIPKGFPATVANARLIAAAPELHEALKKARQTLWECAQDTIGTPTEALFRQEVAECDAVIAKAEGTD